MSIPAAILALTAAAMWATSTSQDAPSAPPTAPRVDPAAAEPPARPSTPPANAESDSPRVADPDAERRDKEAAFRRAFLPEPLATERMDRLAEELGIVGTNRDLLREALQRYGDAWPARDEQHSREVAILLPAAYRFDHVRKEFEPVHTPELLSALRVRDTVGRGVMSREALLMRELEALTPPEHRLALRRFQVDRANELHGRPAQLPAAGVNLLELLPRAGLSSEELGGVAIQLDQYAERLIQEIRNRHTRLRRLERETAESLVSLGPEWRAGRTADEALAVDRDLAQLAVEETLADLPLRDLNQAQFEAIRRQLVPTAARRATEAYQRIVHPHLFEDERLFRLVVEDMLALPTIERDQIAASIDMLTALEDRLRPLGQQTVQLADGLIAANQLAPADAAAARILLEGSLQSALARRRSHVRDALRQLKPIVAAEQAAFAERLDLAVAVLAAQDRAGEFLMQALAQRGQELEMLRALGEEPAAGSVLPGQPETKLPTTSPVSPNEATDPPDPAMNPEAGGSSEKPNGTSSNTTSTPRRGRGSRR